MHSCSGTLCAPIQYSVIYRTSGFAYPTYRQYCARCCTLDENVACTRYLSNRIANRLIIEQSRGRQGNLASTCQANDPKFRLRNHVYHIHYCYVAPLTSWARWHVLVYPTRAWRDQSHLVGLSARVARFLHTTRQRNITLSDPAGHGAHGCNRGPDSLVEAALPL